MSTDRPYQSTLREERAQDTRVRIRRAAADLFASEGFANVTVARIAGAAGVATPTVYSVFGSKAGIVAAMLEELEEHAGQAGMIDEVFSTTDAAVQVRAFARWLARFYDGGAPIIRAAVGAASVDEAAREVARRGDQARREGTGRLVALWSEADRLRVGLTSDEAADQLWLVTSVEQFLFATDRLGWDGEHYERWLADLIERQFLG